MLYYLLRLIKVALLQDCFPIQLGTCNLGQLYDATKQTWLKNQLAFC